MGRRWSGSGAGWLVGLLVVAMAATATRAQDELAFARAKHLRRGINLSMWYAQATDYSAERLASYTTPADLKAVRYLGFDHVRLSIDPEPLVADATTGALRDDAMARLDETVRQITSLGLVVVLDIHPQESWKKQAISKDEGAAQLFLFWKSFAQHFAGTDPEKVYFEVLNEPEGVSDDRWAQEQARAIEIIRSQAPQHTIIATGEDWGGIDGLLEVKPVRDDNVIYSFHDYEPMEFTHQGATWSSPNLATLRGVSYPSMPGLAGYGQQGWDIHTTEKRIGLAVAWAKRRHVPLWCGEFGVYRKYAPAADRARWIADMRKSLEKDGIGWAMWDYQGSFGLVTKKDGTTSVDSSVVEALGLNDAK
jgi:endoglucanase